MARYLITGRGGTGKSTICAALRRKGYPAFDADEVKGLCRWEDRQTGRKIAVDPANYIDFEKVAWAWQDKVVQRLFRAHPNIILCGSSSNQEDYYPQFGTIFVLMVDKHEHDLRLRSRDKDYGKNPRLRRQLVDRHQIFAKNLLENGAIPLDGNQPLKKVAADILRHVNYDS